MATKQSRVPIRYETYKKLLAKKLKEQNQAGELLTWDEFLLKKCDC